MTKEITHIYNKGFIGTTMLNIGNISKSGYKMSQKYN